MNRVIAVDPGLRHSGVAIFEGGLLVRAMLAKNPVKKGADATALAAMADTIMNTTGGLGFVQPEVVVVERMQAYDVTHQKGDQNDLISLAILAGMLRPDYLYLPREWKGQLPKAAMGERILSRLSLEERNRIVDAGALTHNVIDAVGIGLHHLGRLAPKRVIPR
jgi:hypothetical protein